MEVGSRAVLVSKPKVDWNSGVLSSPPDCSTDLSPCTSNASHSETNLSMRIYRDRLPNISHRWYQRAWKEFCVFVRMTLDVKCDFLVFSAESFAMTSTQSSISFSGTDSSDDTCPLAIRVDVTWLHQRALHYVFLRMNHSMTYISCPSAFQYLKLSSLLPLQKTDSLLRDLLKMSK